MTSYYYQYKGTISVSENGCRSCILGDVRNYDKAPAAVTIPCAGLAKYLNDRGWTDAEERYINQTFIFDRNLFLQAVIIPSGNNNTPAKVIACADPEHMSDEIVIFGPTELIDRPDPEIMDRDDFFAWVNFRNEFGLRPQN